MPMSVTQRAEKVLLDVSRLFTSLQSEAFAIQERTAKKTKLAYEHQVRTLQRKPIIEGLGLVGTGCFFFSPNLLKFLNDKHLVSDQVRTRLLQKLEDKSNQQQGMEWIKQATSALSSLVDPSNVDSNAELQRLGQQAQEISSFQAGLQSAIQTHQTALQRLQNNESSAKAAG